MPQQKTNYRDGRPSSSKYIRYTFFTVLMFVTLWGLPTSIKVFKSDFMLMSAKYSINQWVAKEGPVDLKALDKASNQLLLANKISPNNPEILLYLGNLNALKGFSYSTEDEVLAPYLYEAAEYYARALDLKPVDPLLWVNYAKVLYVVAPESDDFKDALANAKVLANNEKYLRKIIDEISA